MIKLADNQECCAACGEPFGDRHICYFNRARVCTHCHTALANGWDPGRPPISHELRGVLFTMATIVAVVVLCGLLKSYWG